MLATSENFLNRVLKYGPTFEVHYDMLLLFSRPIYKLVVIELVHLASGKYCKIVGDKSDMMFHLGQETL